MINFGTPEHGWLEIRVGDDKHTYEISDVGPDSIDQFSYSLSKLSSGDTGATVECYLEPSILRITFTSENEQVKVKLELNDSVEAEYTYPLNLFLEEFSSEVKRLIPLCKEPHWTHPNWS